MEISQQNFLEEYFILAVKAMECKGGANVVLGLYSAVQCPALLDGKVMYYWHGIIVIVNNTIIILKLFYRSFASRSDIIPAHQYGMDGLIELNTLDASYNVPSPTIDPNTPIYIVFCYHCSVMTHSYPVQKQQHSRLYVSVTNGNVELERGSE